MFGIGEEMPASAGARIVAEGTARRPPRRVSSDAVATTSGPGDTGAGETADLGGAPATTERAERHGRRLALSTAIFSAATGLSRVLGLIREVVAKNYFGVRGPVNAFEI